MKNGAADWRTGEKLSFLTYDNENVDIHHIFPKAWCEKASPRIPPALYNSVINKTPVDAGTNRVIGGGAPSGYLRRLEKNIPPQQLKNLLQSHWVKPVHLTEDDFAEFFVARGEAMLSLIGQAMGREPGSGREVFLEALGSVGIGASYIELGETKSQAEEFEDEAEYSEFGDLSSIFEEEQTARV